MILEEECDEYGSSLYDDRLDDLCAFELIGREIVWPYEGSESVFKNHESDDGMVGSSVVFSGHSVFLHILNARYCDEVSLTTSVMNHFQRVDETARSVRNPRF